MTVVKHVQVLVNSKGTGKMASGFKGAGVAAAGATVAIGALIVAVGASVKVAADFESRMADISTLISGDSTEAINGLKEGILDMAKVIPKSPDELGAAAYDIVSAGIEGTSDQLLVLKESAKLAVAGLGDTEGAVDIMTSSINSFKLEAKDSNKIADILFKTVKFGKTTVDELSMSFGATAPTVAAAGFALEDFQAATAALTTTGMPASVAQNSLRQSVVSLTKPTKEMSELFNKMGTKGLPEMIDKGMTMGDIFQSLDKAAGGNAETLTKAFGSVEAYNAAIGVGSIVNESYTDTLKDMKSGAVAIDEAFAKQTATFNNFIQLTKNKANVILIKLGSVIIPKLLAGVDWLKKAWAAFQDIIQQNVIADFIAAISADFSVFSDSIKSMFGGMGTSIRDVENKILMFVNSPAFKNWLTIIKELLLDVQNAILTHIVPAVIRLKDKIEELVTSKEFKEIMQGLQDAFVIAKEVITTQVIPAIEELIDAIIFMLPAIIPIFKLVVFNIKLILTVLGWVIAIVRGINKAIIDFVKRLIQRFKDAWNWIKTATADAWNWIKTAISDAWEWIKTAISDAWEWLKTATTDTWEWIKTAIGDAWNGIKDTVGGAINVLINSFRKVKNKISAIWEDLWDGLTGVVSGAGSSIGGILKNVLNSLVDILNSGIRLINSALDKARGVPGLGKLITFGNIPEIPKLAEGGPLQAGQTAIVGERGPELFTPRSTGDITPNDKLGGGVTVHIGQIVTNNPREFAMQLRRALADELRQSDQGVL